MANKHRKLHHLTLASQTLWSPSQGEVRSPHLHTHSLIMRLASDTFSFWIRGKRPNLTCSISLFFLLLLFHAHLNPTREMINNSSESRNKSFSKHEIMISMPLTSFIWVYIQMYNRKGSSCINLPKNILMTHFKGMGVISSLVNAVCPFIFQRMSRHLVSSPHLSRLCIVTYVNPHVIDADAALSSRCKLNYHY